MSETVQLVILGVAIAVTVANAVIVAYTMTLRRRKSAIRMTSPEWIEKPAQCPNREPHEAHSWFGGQFGVRWQCRGRGENTPLCGCDSYEETLANIRRANQRRAEFEAHEKEQNR